MQESYTRLGCRWIRGCVVISVVLGSCFAVDRVNADRFSRRMAKNRGAQFIVNDYQTYTAPAEPSEVATEKAVESETPEISKATVAPLKPDEANVPESAGVKTSKAEGFSDVAIAQAPVATDASLVESSETLKGHWFTDWEEALLASKTLERPLLIHFYSAYCGPCKRMEQTVFSQETIQVLAGSYFILVKVDGEKASTVRDQYNVTTYPSDFVVTPNGQVIARKTGFQDSAQFSSFLTKAAARVGLPPMTVSVNEQWRQLAIQSDLRGAENAVHDAGVVPNVLAVPALEDYPIEENPAKIAEITGEVSLHLDDLEVVGQSGKTMRNKPQLEEVLLEEESLNLLDLQEVPEEGPTLNVATGSTGSTGLTGSTEDEENLPEMDTKLNAELAEIYEDTMPSAPNRAKVFHTAYAPITERTTMLDGYCPVTMVDENRWALGDLQFMAYYQNGIYFFSTAYAREKFIRNPEFYALVSDGLDIVLLTDDNTRKPGVRRLGIRYCDLNFVFATEESQEKFRENPDAYVSAAQKIIAQQGEANRH